MKLYNIILLFCISLLLTSCLTEPSHPVNHNFVCSINADGTGFTKLLDINDLPFPISDLFDLYVTEDGKLIFRAYRLYITEPDSINPVFLTDYSTGFSLSNDNKAYYSLNGDLYQYDFTTQTHNNLTNNYGGYLENPIISPDDSIISLVRKSQDINDTSTLCYFSLSDDSLHLVPEAGTSTRRGIYNPLNHKLYHEQSNGLYKIDLDGTQNSQLLAYTSIPRQTFGFTSLNDNLVTVDVTASLRIFNLNNETTLLNQQLTFPVIMPKITKNSNKVFYVINGSIYYYNLDNLNSIKVPNTSGVQLIMCPTWDASKIYYMTSVRINK
jgi:hypothetical protein